MLLASMVSVVVAFTSSPCHRCKEVPFKEPRLGRAILSSITRKVANKIHLKYTDKEVTSFVTVVLHESGGRPTAQNKKTKAYGLMQFIPRTWIGVGIRRTSCPYCQIEAGLLYIKYRYKNSASRALTHFNSMRWY